MIVEKEHAGGCVDTAGFRLGASFALTYFVLKKHHHSSNLSTQLFCHLFFNRSSKAHTLPSQANIPRLVPSFWYLAINCSFLVEAIFNRRRILGGLSKKCLP